MIKTGQDIENELEYKAPLEPQEYHYEVGEKSILASYTTSRGDQFILCFTSKNRELYNAVAEVALQSMDDYTLIEKKRLIYLPPKTYWHIYKKLSYGYQFIKGIGYSMKINNQPYHFPSTNFYFSPELNPQGERAVYGIYLYDQLLYIGSSGTGVELRWKEHHEGFKTQSMVNQMYRQGYNPLEIEYRVLKTANELQQELNLQETPSTWLIELVEKSYIEALQPPFNIEGVTQPFRFQANTFYGEVPRNYWEIVKEWLENPDKEIPKELKETSEILI